MASTPSTRPMFAAVFASARLLFEKVCSFSTSSRASPLDNGVFPFLEELLHQHIGKARADILRRTERRGRRRPDGHVLEAENCDALLLLRRAVRRKHNEHGDREREDSNHDVHPFP